MSEGSTGVYLPEGFSLEANKLFVSHKGMIILGDGGHRDMGYVTPASDVELFSKLCKLFDLMTSR